ncbi:hypothetical protein D9M70_552700 [compost metagenome]
MSVRRVNMVVTWPAALEVAGLYPVENHLVNAGMRCMSEKMAGQRGPEDASPAISPLCLGGMVEIKPERHDLAHG